MIEPREAASRAREVLGLLGFLLVATAQVSNMILARGVAGSVPPFSIAFFRWSIVALGLLPVVVMALREKSRLVARAGPRHRGGRFSRHVHLRRTGLRRRRYDLGDQSGADHGAFAARGTAVFFRVRPGSHSSKPDHRHAAVAGGRGADHYQGASRSRGRRGGRGPARADGDAGLGGLHPVAEPGRQRCELSGADRPVRRSGRAVLAALRHPRNVVCACRRVQRTRGAGVSLCRVGPRPVCLFGLCLSRRQSSARCRRP